MANFTVPVVCVLKVETHPDESLQHLSIVRVLDKICIAGKLDNGEHRYKEGDLVVYVPVNAVIPLDYLKLQGFYWDKDKNRGLLKGNKRNRVGPVTRGSVTSEGILLPVEYDLIDRDYYVKNVPHHDVNKRDQIEDLIVREGDNLAYTLCIYEHINVDGD